MDELRAKYIPPEINECQEKEERGKVGKLDLTDESDGFRDCLKRAFESRTGETIMVKNDLDSMTGRVILVTSKSVPIGVKGRP